MPKYVFIILLTLLNLVYSQSKICDYCNKVIEGRYIQVDGKYFHPEHFKCDKCGKPIEGKYITVDKKYYHPECYDEKKVICDYCGKPIEGKHYIKDGKKYHPECYDKYIALKCDVCLEPIKGKYLIDSHGNKYCAKHEGENPICDNCGRIISKNTTGGGKRYSDGREMCNLCYHKSITGYQSIERIYENVLSTLSSIGIEIGHEYIELIPANRNTLRNASGKNYSNSMKGYCKSERKIIIEDGIKTILEKYTIYILDGVPEEYLAASIAHELMHVWLIQNTGNDQSPQLMEGSCNFCSYLYLLADASPLSTEVIKALENDPDENYGDGFRMVKRNFQSESVIHFLNYLKSHNSI